MTLRSSAGREVLHKDSYLLNMELEEEMKKNARLRDAIEILKVSDATPYGLHLTLLSSEDRQRDCHRYAEEGAGRVSDQAGSQRV